MSQNVEQAAHERASVGEALVQIDGLKTYYEDGGLLSSHPVKAVDGVSFEIDRGETLGLVGESGCGKTTLGRTLVQLESATDGEILFDGTDITELRGDDLKEWRRRTQMVFQDPDSSLNNRMTIGEIVREPLDVHAVGTPRERRARVRELLEVVGLREEHYYRYPHQFSGGQRQRIGIARALALEPEFIVLDEPVSALDVSVQAQILNLLEDLQKEFDLTYLFIAHDLSVVRHICDRVAVMYLGHVMEIGATEEMFRDPANPYTQSLLSAIPEPDPSHDTDRITLRGTPPSPRDPPEGCPFSTRCPMKVRPSAYRDLDGEVWERIQIFREVLRQRMNAEMGLKDRIRDLLGRDTRFSDIDEIREELFGDVTLPDSVRGHIEEAIDYVADADEAAAHQYLDEQFGSTCDEDPPIQHDVGGGRLSLCHRHLDDHANPEDVHDELNVFTGESE